MSPARFILPRGRALPTPARAVLAVISGALPAAIVALASWGVPGCDPSPSTHTNGTSACVCDSASPVVDTALLAFLSKARVLHREADAAEEAHDLAKAIAALERITSAALPGGAQPPPEAREVMADTWARLAELRGQSGQSGQPGQPSQPGALDQAAKDVQSGLRYATETSYFRGHLFEVLGGIEERRASAAEKAGDAAAAKVARERAVAAGEQAVKIQEEVINRVTEKGKSP